MAFGSMQDDNDEVMGEINMIPLIDVMLVLLIVFIITVPVMKHAVNIDLPRADNEQQQPQPQAIQFSIAEDGSYWWNQEKIDDALLEPRLQEAAAQEPQPEFHIRGDKAVRYERVAQAMAAAQRTGVRKIGFITEPDTP